jgi:hypothetical protein
MQKDGENNDRFKITELEVWQVAKDIDSDDIVYREGQCAIF